MSIRVSGGGGGETEPTPTGLQQAILAKVIDLGTQASEYMGQKKETHQVYFLFELKEKMTIEAYKGKPFVTGGFYTLSWYKSNMLNLVEGMLGRALTKDEISENGTGLDIESLVGTNTNLTLIKEEGKKFTKIKSASPLMTGQEPITEIVIQEAPAWVKKIQAKAVDYVPSVDEEVAQGFIENLERQETEIVDKFVK